MTFLVANLLLLRGTPLHSQQDELCAQTAGIINQQAGTNNSLSRPLVKSMFHHLLA